MDLPATAAWRHVEARDGFEVLFPRAERSGDIVLAGHSCGVEEGVAWAVRYRIVVGPGWRTRSAHITGWSEAGRGEVRLEADGAGAWRIDGRPAPQLDGVLDVDLEASACTNVLPVRRLALEVGARSEAPAAYVRAPGLELERLEQSYARLEDEGTRRRYDYAAARFDFFAVLAYDESGLVLDYPGLAVRVA